MFNRKIFLVVFFKITDVLSAAAPNARHGVIAANIPWNSI
jgi:hypothetical protein